MKSLKLYLIILMTIAFVSVASAQLDPDPDGIGLYADLGGMQNWIDVAPFTAFDIHVLGTNLVHDVWYWALAIQLDEGVVITGQRLPYEAGSDIHGQQGSVYYSFTSTTASYECIPLEAGPIVHLGTFEAMVVDSLPKVLSATQHPAYEDYELPEYHDCGGPTLPLTPSSGSNGVPFFAINGTPPVANETAVWSTIKTLYR